MIIKNTMLKGMRFKLLISLLFGFFSGWAVTNAGAITPDAIEQFIGNALARSQSIQSISELITNNEKAAASAHIWIVAFGMAMPSIVLMSVCAFLVARWSGKTRYVAYASLIYPMYIILGAAFIARFVLVDEAFTRTFAAVYSPSLSGVVINLVVYFSLFYLLLLSSKKFGQKEI